MYLLFLAIGTVCTCMAKNYTILTHTAIPNREQ